MGRTTPMATNVWEQRDLAQAGSSTPTRMCRQGSLTLRWLWKGAGVCAWWRSGTRSVADTSVQCRGQEQDQDVQETRKGAVAGDWQPAGSACTPALERCSQAQLWASLALGKDRPRRKESRWRSNKSWCVAEMRSLGSDFPRAVPTGPLPLTELSLLPRRWQGLWAEWTCCGNPAVIILHFCTELELPGCRMAVELLLFWGDSWGCSRLWKRRNFVYPQGKASRGQVKSVCSLGVQDW